MRLVSKLKRRIRQFREIQAAKGRYIGSGSQGHVFGLTVRRKNRSREYAAKHFRFADKNWNSYSSYVKLRILGKLGFRTVPVLLPTNKRRLVMKDLSENGSKRVVDMGEVLMRYSRLLGDPAYYEKVEQNNETMFRITTGVTNYKELAREYEEITDKANKLGINFGASDQAIMVVIDKNKHGQLWIADVVETSIPVGIIKKEMIPKQFLHLLKDTRPRKERDHAQRI